MHICYYPVIYGVYKSQKKIFMNQPETAEAHRLNLAEGQVERKIQEAERKIANTFKLVEGLKKKKSQWILIR